MREYFPFFNWSVVALTDLVDQFLEFSQDHEDGCHGLFKTIVVVMYDS